MSQCEKTENQAEQNKSHAVAGIEAHPTPPHCCFLRNDRCNLAHADLECGVTGRELWAPERIDEVDYSERKGNARTKNHENFCGQDALLFCGALLIPFSFATISLLARDAPQSSSMPQQGTSFRELSLAVSERVPLQGSLNRDQGGEMADGAPTT